VARNGAGNNKALQRAESEDNMSYWYEVYSPIQDGPDDSTWERIGPEFGSMINAINYARRHEDSKLIMVLKDIDGKVDSVELPVNGAYSPFAMSKTV
jgi:hypothetical protein